MTRIYGGETGIRTLDTAFQPYNGLANRRLQPLGHLSDSAIIAHSKAMGDKTKSISQRPKTQGRISRRKIYVFRGKNGPSATLRAGQFIRSYELAERLLGRGFLVTGCRQAPVGTLDDHGNFEAFERFGDILIRAQKQGVFE